MLIPTKEVDFTTSSFSLSRVITKVPTDTYQVRTSSSDITKSYHSSKPSQMNEPRDDLTSLYPISNPIQPESYEIVSF